MRRLQDCTNDYGGILITEQEIPTLLKVGYFEDDSCYWSEQDKWFDEEESDENELNFIYNKWDKLPFRESRWEYWTRVTNISGWSFPWHKHYFTSNKCPYKIKKRILKSSIGDSFDNAFSKYCKLVEPRYQKDFEKEFSSPRLSYYYNRNDSNFYLNEYGIILVKPKIKKNLYVIRSKDFQTVKEYVHKIIGDKISKETFEILPNKYGRKYGYYLQDQYEEVIKVIKGYEFEVGCNDYRYKRYRAELNQKQKAERKFAKKQKAARVYDFMTEREKFNKANKLDKQKLQSHGFDENSFKRHHGRKYRKSHKLEKHE